MRAFANAKHGSKSPSHTAFIENDSEVKKGGARNIRTPPSQMRSLLLEREINAAAHHAEVIVRTVDKVPAEIIDPADVWRKANFQATAHLTDCPCFRIGFFGPNGQYWASRHKARPFTTAKHPSDVDE